MLRIIEDRLWSAFLNDLSTVHEDNSVGCLAGETHLVGNNHHGCSISCQFLHQVENAADSFRVERRCYLVEQHDLGCHGQ